VSKNKFKSYENGMVTEEHLGLKNSAVFKEKDENG